MDGGATVVRRTAKATVSRASGRSALQVVGRLSNRFTSGLHDERVASWLGVWLGVSFTIAFLTGLISHFMQHPPAWAHWPARPVNLYRVTQGVHVIGGLATVPLLLAKLWTVYPKLWQWPPVRSAGHALARGFIFVLVAGAIFQFVTGVLNIAYWYAFPFFFTAAHYWTGYIVMGALLIHVANEWATVRRSIGPLRPAAPLGAPAAPVRPSTSDSGGLSRRGFFATVAAACGVIKVTTVGETFTPLARLAVLAPRRPGIGPQRLPVNRSAVDARIEALAQDPAWRLSVSGAVPRESSLSLAELRGMASYTARLPITCVEGWSAEGTWRGVRLRDVLEAAGATAGANVRVESLERNGRYRTSVLDPPHWQDPLTLLALDLNGAPLSLDHGRPCRLIAPNLPGVMQTKWISGLVVLAP
jgi:hypothetical protein